MTKEKHELLVQAAKEIVANWPFGNPSALTANTVVAIDISVSKLITVFEADDDQPDIGESSSG